jgi:hypothetical protein
MRRKVKFFGLIVIAFAVMSSCGLSSCTPSEVTIQEDDDGEWRIYDKRNNNQGTWTVKEGDKITWVVTGSDMLFSFPLDMGTYFEFEDGFFTEIDSMNTGPENDPRRIERVDEGDTLSLIVKDREYAEVERAQMEKVKSDTIDYDIYVYDAEKYVIGNSPPYIIVQRSY